MSKSYQHNEDEIINVSEPVVAYSTRKERPLSSVHDSVHKRVMDTTVSVDEYFDELISQVREDYVVVDRILPVKMNKG
jgi:hypothetical protein